MAWQTMRLKTNKYILILEETLSNNGRFSKVLTFSIVTLFYDHVQNVRLFKMLTFLDYSLL